MVKEMMTTKDVANYLNLNEKKVYSLVKLKRIPCTRATGKWTFPKKLIDEWIEGQARASMAPDNQSAGLDSTIIFAGSDDFLIDALARLVTKRCPRILLSSAKLGSTAGILALSRGAAHLAGCHLLEPETGLYNIPHLSRYAPGLNPLVVNLAWRHQGFLLKKGNPRGVSSLRDLTRPDIVFINRQLGAGTRHLLDCYLSREGIDPGVIRGYSRCAGNHLEVGLAVLRGEADVGLGTMAAAAILDLDFIPVRKERYDLVIPEENFHTEKMAVLLDVLCSGDFEEAARSLGGYEMHDCGKVLSA